MGQRAERNQENWKARRHVRSVDRKRLSICLDAPSLQMVTRYPPYIPSSTDPPSHTVIPNEAGRRFFFPFHSCEMVGLRSEESLFTFLVRPVPRSLPRGSLEVRRSRHRHSNKHNTSEMQTSP